MPKVYSNLAIPPGEYLAEVIEGMGLTWGQFAIKIGWSANKLCPIIYGATPLIPEHAETFAKHTDVPAHIWTGLKEKYRETLRRNKEQGHA